jgi:hypothetical protein
MNHRALRTVVEGDLDIEVLRIGQSRKFFARHRRHFYFSGAHR